MEVEGALNLKWCSVEEEKSRLSWCPLHSCYVFASLRGRYESLSRNLQSRVVVFWREAEFGVFRPIRLMYSEKSYSCVFRVFAAIRFVLWR
ncbi:hypothetical protein AKJ16_DCAP12894 [Drosera capensis]